MLKLKNILKEGYAWEREPGKPLPTLEQTSAAYAAKMQEQGGSKPDYIDSDDDDEEIEQKGFNLGYIIAEQLVDLLTELPDEKQYLAINGFVEGFNNWEIDEINVSKSETFKNEMQEQVGSKPDYIDLDNDGDEEESMKKAARDAKQDVNELTDDEIDKRWNTPMQMYFRNTDVPKKKTMSPNDMKSQSTPSKFYQEKLSALQAQRQQLEFDMEQEAEPEGGPIADYYGEALQHVDDQISSIMSKIRKNESTLTTKGGLQEMRELPLEQRILRNFKGNDFILSETFKK